MIRPATKVLIISESGSNAATIRALENVVATFPRLISITGKDCSALEDICDEFCERTEQGLQVTTTSHPEETLAEVEEFVRAFGIPGASKDFLTIKV